MKVLHECLDNDSPHLICKHCGAVGRCEKDDPPMPPRTKTLALALAILREHNAWHIAQDEDGSYDDSGLQEQTLAAIHALEQEAAQPVQAAPERCGYCDGTGDVTSITGEWRGYCHCPEGVALKAKVAAPTDAQIALLDPWMRPEAARELLCKVFAAVSVAAPVSAEDALTQAAADVLAERRRQVEVEGYDEAHDDGHTSDDLMQAAVCYAIGATFISGSCVDMWPWDRAAWKPATTRRNRVRAAALLLAAIERDDRAAKGESK